MFLKHNKVKDVPGFLKNAKISINTMEYEASHGEEFFIQAEDDNILFGFCRMRYPGQVLRKEITKKTAIIRELHVFGQAVDLGKKGDVQHRGLGKKLLLQAENIAKKNGKNKMVVISGIGVKEYYAKLGYHKEGPYMVKTIST